MTTNTTFRLLSLIRYINNKNVDEPIQKIDDITVEIVRKTFHSQVVNNNTINEIVECYCKQIKEWLIEKEISKTSWKNGSMFCSVLEKVGLYVIGWRQMKHLQRIKTAIKMANEHGVPQILTAEEVMLCKDEIPILLYLSNCIPLEFNSIDLNKSNALIEKDKKDKIVDLQVRSLCEDAVYNIEKQIQNKMDHIIFHSTHPPTLLERTKSLSNFYSSSSISSSQCGQNDSLLNGIDNLKTILPSCNPVTTKKCRTKSMVCSSRSSVIEGGMKKKQIFQECGSPVVKEQPLIIEEQEGYRLQIKQRKHLTMKQTTKSIVHKKSLSDTCLNEENKKTKTLTLTLTQEKQIEMEVKNKINHVTKLETHNPQFIKNELFSLKQIELNGNCIRTEAFGGSQRYIQLKNWIGLEKCEFLGRCNLNDTQNIKDKILGKKNIVLIIRIDGCVFGSYVSRTITQKGVKKDSKFFIFSLLNINGVICKFKPTNNNKKVWTIHNDDNNKVLSIQGFLKISTTSSYISTKLSYMYDDYTLLGSDLFAGRSKPHVFSPNAIEFYHFT